MKSGRLHIRFGKSRELILLAAIGLPKAVLAQPMAITPCHWEASHPRWLVYANREFHFCLKYPPTYHWEAAPAPDQFSNGRRFLAQLVLDRLPPGTTGNAVNNHAGIDFVYLPKHFSIETLQNDYAPTGMEDIPPKAFRFDRTVFYFYGAGGGGASYPDEFFTNLRGRILLIQFDGPYRRSKSPIEETQALEKEVLPTFRTY